MIDEKAQLKNLPSLYPGGFYYFRSLDSRIRGNDKMDKLSNCQTV